MPARQPPRTATIWNNNGGGGKTTCAVNGGSALGRAGEDVLVIDFDPQEGNLTDHVGFDSILEDEYYNVSDILIDPDNEKNLNDLILPAEETGLDFDLLPSHSELGEFDKRVTVEIESNQMTLLRWAMKDANLFEQYSCIIIDAQASKGLLVKNALVATQNVVVPIKLARKGVRSVEGLEKYIERQQKQLLRDGIDLDFGIIGVIGNLADNPLTNEERIHLEQLQKNGKPVAPFTLRDQSIVSEAWGHKMSLFEYVEQEDVRVRDYHKPTLKHFEQIGELILHGDISVLEAYNDGESDSTEVMADV